MGGEIYTTWPEGATLYAIIRRLSDGAVYSAADLAFETWSDGNIGNYDIPLNDQDGNHYSTDFPTGIAAGQYKVDIFLQAGGSPADGDWSPSHGWINWGGLQGEISSDLLNDKVDSLEEAILALQKTLSITRTVIEPKPKSETKARIYI